MGGKNHQPCGQYLQNSTKMSRFMSLAFMTLEQANVALEDVILAEFNNGKGNVDDIVSQLVASANYLDDMKSTVADLRQQMADLNYVDLPPLARMDMSAFGQQLVAGGLHTSQSDYNDAATIMVRGGFWEMISVFDARIDELIDQTSNLREAVIATNSSATTGELHLVLEENRVGNFKPKFAELYTSWASFQQLFLASSLISTEVWYQFNRSGSLIENVGVRAVA